MRTLYHLRFGALAAVCLAFCGASDGLASAYRVTELPTLGGTQNVVTAISSAGWVTGYSQTKYGPAHAFIFDGSSMKDLGTLPGYVESWGYGINDLGQVTGALVTTRGTATAFVYDGTTMRNIGSDGLDYCQGTAINDAGVVAGFGWINGSANSQRGFVFDGTTFKGAGGNNANGINASGEVTGSMSISQNGSKSDHAYLFDGLATHDLGTLPGYVDSSGSQVNSTGEVAGWAYSTGGIYRAFLYDGTTMMDLGTLGGPGSFSSALNDAGDVVGWSDTSAGGQDAFVDANGQMEDLNALIPSGSGIHLDDAVGINDSGQIIASGTDASGNTSSAFLLTPTPEPSTGLLLGSAFAFLLLRGRRKFSKS